MKPGFPAAFGAFLNLPSEFCFRGMQWHKACPLRFKTLGTLMIAIPSRFLLMVVLSLSTTVAAEAQDRFLVGTNWLPDAERGGFYQAEAAGMYKKHGLDVTVQAGGPQLNNPQLLAAGKLDGVMITSALEAFNYALTPYQSSPLLGSINAIRKS